MLLINKKMALFPLFGNFEAKGSQNRCKKETTFYKYVVHFYFTNLQVLVLSGCSIY
jgi:hypothetical protein